MSFSDSPWCYETYILFEDNTKQRYFYSHHDYEDEFGGWVPGFSAYKHFVEPAEKKTGKIAAAVCVTFWKQMVSTASGVDSMGNEFTTTTITRLLQKTYTDTTLRHFFQSEALNQKFEKLLPILEEETGPLSERKLKSVLC